MKKVLFTAIAAMAMVAMVACNNKKAAEEPVMEEAVAVEECEHHCAMDSTCTHECMCSEECKAANCEACPNHGTENCCKAKMAAAEGQACEKACEHKCEKACEKKCDKPCEHKCEKAQ